ncbi:DUF2851 domain-containing protein [Chitinophaga alhagiae]|uniref:DUF2851 domain-containing protein n=1 Tax=Chitinophaga alhagiae TaxID=2203219 RepID=A0ABN5LM43_9BACT|nr:DUF2851 family protein [Chitinophaga alhagiae]AWO00456.1 DUF2851 domain-containing protein [Chitinophaga alhagiae]
MSTVNPLFSEELLQHIWQFRLFNQQNLATVNGEPLYVVHPGELNRHAGPDFTGARLRIGGMEWAGNVELHYRTSDWRRHGHHRNPRYDNVVLHVVFEHDAPFHTAPCLELQHRIPKLMLKRYRALKESAAFVPCAPLLHRVNEDAWGPWKARLLHERLQRKANVLRGWLEQSRCNWEEVCFRAVAQGFGMPVNTAAFLELSFSLPFMVLARQRSCLPRLEALLFGQSGMLGGAFADAYPQELQREYRFLQHKYRLEPMAAHSWQWLRMRPSSFPTMRIACFAALLHNSPHLFSRLLETERLPEAESLFVVEPSAYWRHHYRFDIPAVRTNGLGKGTVQHLFINTVAPLLHLYGDYMGLPQYKQRALRFLQELPAENNRVLRGWAEEQVPAANAADSQALLQLKQSYCDTKNCLNCAIGERLLRGEEVWVCREGEEDDWM